VAPLSRGGLARGSLMIMEGVCQIDGSILEGGGQILRNTVALSAILKKSIVIDKIRAGRGDAGNTSSFLLPSLATGNQMIDILFVGLKLQHLCGINLVGEMVNAEMVGNTKGSGSLAFNPRGYSHSTDYIGDIGSAGSITLLCQTALPPSLFHPSRSPLSISLIGGTHVTFTPHLEYFTQVLLPTLKLMGVHADAQVKRLGFYPKGGGHVQLNVSPLPDKTPLVPISLVEQGDIVSVKVTSFTAGNVPAHVAKRAIASACKVIRKGM
jgi:RNA 3'-terminal phosphate cyclase (ATP)